MAKIDMVVNVVDMYKKLPQEKQVFVLGIMQGILIAHPEQGDQFLKEKERKIGQTKKTQ